VCELRRARSNAETKSCSCMWTTDENCLKCINVQWPVAYAENFCGAVSFRHMVVIRIWCALFVTSYSCFQTNVLAKFVDARCMFFHTHSPYFMCHCTEYKLSALQVKKSKEDTHNATTQQFITANISGCALKQGMLGVKHTHHCIRAIYNCKMRLRWCLIEYAHTHKNWNYTRIEECFGTE